MGLTKDSDSKSRHTRTTDRAPIEQHENRVTHLSCTVTSPLGGAEMERVNANYSSARKQTRILAK